MPPKRKNVGKSKKASGAAAAAPVAAPVVAPEPVVPEVPATPVISTTPVGLALGNDFVTIALHRNNGAEVIVNEDGERATPAWVAYTTRYVEETEEDTPADEEPAKPETEVILGTTAQRQFLRNMQHTIPEVMRLLAFMDDPEGAQKAKSLQKWPFSITERAPTADDPSRIAVELNLEHLEETQLVTPTELLAALIGGLKGTAEGILSSIVREAVLSVPTNLTEVQLAAIRSAADKCGLKLSALISEPAAAALALLDEEPLVSAEPENILVFDFGGSSVSTTVLRRYVGETFEIVASKVDTATGARALDDLLANHLLRDISRKLADISDNRRAMIKLRMECERIKRTLSQSTTAPVFVESLHDGMDFAGSNMSRSHFEVLITPMIQSLLNSVDSFLTVSNIPLKSIQRVILTGGGSAIPLVQRKFSELFGEGVPVIREQNNPQETVARGAALHAFHLFDQLKPAADEPLPELPTVCADNELRALTKAVGLAGADGKFVPLLPAGTAVPVAISVTCEVAGDDKASILSIVAGDSETAAENTSALDIMIPASAGPEVNLLLSVDRAGSVSARITSNDGSEVVSVSA
ncbi:hypothetical protein H696_02231 [Fonticula alba]|uniref:Uncharacterized protein n=1 Tax=Fonticula alba TaxID=691883 RepID=A0A058ZAE9_FONAL|nr:hypothetical protein H696_02231 [Fonticula alba]KCV71285.1 hypothetical protein H696_02231 [Fonticula alba]|eukprot:XP_009494408.1 hypothetical protein H696_02231 [Fonticula alba]